MALENALRESLGTEYEIEGELGGGGMSRVFLAHDTVLNRRVVVKVLTPELAATVSADRFEREILIAAGLQHPNIVPILSAGTADDLPYFVMPFVEGESLRNRLKLLGKLSVKETVSILKDVARALAFAHDRGVIHRDIKPDNILLSSGAAMLADFGVAKAVSSSQTTTPVEGDAALTRIGTSLGTPRYMAPEQAAADESTDHRADIYALGITSYEMLVGDPPFEASSATALLAAHLTKMPEPLTKYRDDVPEWLASLIADCLAKDPDHRPPTADHLLDRLEDVRTDAIPSVTRPVKRRWLVAAASAALVIAIVAVGLPMWRPPRVTSTADFTAIAVLPFVNVSMSSDDEYFADGLTDELIGALGRIPALRVASRTGSYAFKGSEAGVDEIGAALNANVLLEGTVRRGGDRLRLTAQLVDVSDGLTLWSETFERQVTDVFELQDELTASIVGALRERVGSGAEVVASAPVTTDLEAYDLYLRGRYFFARRGDESLRRALEYFEAAVAIDDDFPEAHVGVADVLSLLPLYTSAPGDSTRPLAMAAVNRAIELDGSLPTAFASRGSLLSSVWEWEEAERDFLQAVTLDPRYATAHQWYGEHLLVRGRVEEAIRELGIAVELDPLSPVIKASYGGALAIANRRDEALRQGLAAIELDSVGAAPRFLYAAAHLYLGNHAEAIGPLERARVSAPDVVGVQGLLGYARAMAGDAETAVSILNGIDRTDLRTGNGMALARIFIGLGELDSAMVWMTRAVAAHDPFFASESMASAIFDPVRSRPDFRSLLEEVGFDPSILTTLR
jgi:serine/threonine-protein kinase